jgi:hypothetical protein
MQWRNDEIGTQRERGDYIQKKRAIEGPPLLREKVCRVVMIKPFANMPNTAYVNNAAPLPNL